MNYCTAISSIVATIMDLITASDPHCHNCVLCCIFLSCVFVALYRNSIRSEWIKKIKSGEGKDLDIGQTGFFSTIPWMYQLMRRHKNHDTILRRMRKIYDGQPAIIDGDPVNILCIDGGGMKGYAMIAIAEIFHEKCEGLSFLHQFDLIVGTSTGGIAALICNLSNNSEEAFAEATNLLDEARTNSFTTFNLKDLIMKGSASRETMLDVLEKRYGDDVPLYNPDGIPACAFCIAREIDNEALGDEKNGCKSNYEPFILRTYDYPRDNSSSTCNSSSEEDIINRNANVFISSDECRSGTLSSLAHTCQPLARSESSTSLIDAMASTSAVPFIFDRIRVSIDGGRRMLFADGSCQSNSPVAIAFDEASRLYGNRPIGTFLSIGASTCENDHVNHAVDLMRKVHPNLHFQRVAPDVSNLLAIETDKRKLDVMEEEVRKYMRDKVVGSEEFEKTIRRLLASDRSQRQAKSQIPSFVTKRNVARQPKIQMQCTQNDTCPKSSTKKKQ